MNFKTLILLWLITTKAELHPIMQCLDDRLCKEGLDKLEQKYIKNFKVISTGIVYPSKARSTCYAVKFGVAKSIKELTKYLPTNVKYDFERQFIAEMTDQLKIYERNYGLAQRQEREAFTLGAILGILFVGGLLGGIIGYQFASGDSLSNEQLSILYKQKIEIEKEFEQVWNEIKTLERPVQNDRLLQMKKEFRRVLQHIFHRDFESIVSEINMEQILALPKFLVSNFITTGRISVSSIDYENSVLNLQYCHRKDFTGIPFYQIQTAYGSKQVAYDGRNLIEIYGEECIFKNNFVVFCPLDLDLHDQGPKCDLNNPCDDEGSTLPSFNINFELHTIGTVYHTQGVALYNELEESGLKRNKGIEQRKKQRAEIDHELVDLLHQPNDGGKKSGLAEMFAKKAGNFAGKVVVGAADGAVDSIAEYIRSDWIKWICLAFITVVILVLLPFVYKFVIKRKKRNEQTQPQQPMPVDESVNDRQDKFIRKMQFSRLLADDLANDESPRNPGMLPNAPPPAYLND